MILLERIKKSVLENKFIFTALAVLIIVNLFLGLTPKKKEVATEPLQADTIIPSGFVLLPINLVNIESIKGLITQFGVIDLYVASTPNSPGKKIASRIKILRAPLNENEFAVLVPEDLSEVIMRASGSFTGVIQNRFAESGGSVVKIKKQPSVQIDYNQENNL